MRNTITVDIFEDDYSEIPNEYRELMTIKVVEPKGYDYSNDWEWSELKKESTRAYKKLKNREYDIRMKK